MDYFPFIIGLIFVATMFHMSLSMRKDAQKLRERLQIPEDDEINKSLFEFVFYNYFRFFMLLLTIVACSMLIGGVFNQ